MASDRSQSNRNSLLELDRMGQSIWYDCIDRYLIRNGGLRYLIDYEAVKGITTNPSILHKAITISRDYDAELAALAGW